MAKKSMIAKQQRVAKFSTQAYTRCTRCGRSIPKIWNLPYLFSRISL